MKNRKIVIDDPNLRHREITETEIADDESIRFENGDNRFTITLDDHSDGIRIYKINAKGDDTIIIEPSCSNVIYVK